MEGGVPWFPCVAVHNGDPYHSNHRLVIIMTEKSDRRRRAVGEKQFAFEASWLLEDHCREVVNEVWESGARFSLSEIKIYRRSWINRINKIYQKYRTKLKKNSNCFEKIS